MRVERIVLFNAALRIQIDLVLDWRQISAAPASTAPAAATAASRTTTRSARPSARSCRSSAQRHSAGGRRRRWALLANRAPHRRSQRITHPVDLQRSLARADEEHAPSLEIVLGARHFAIREGQQELVVLAGNRG